VEAARRVVSDHTEPVTLRQVFYRLVAQGLIPNRPPVYRRLSSRLAQSRRDGAFPDLVDTLRTVHVPASWPDAGTFLRQAAAQFALDRTRGQSRAVYVAAEKDTLRQVFTTWLAPMGIPVLVVRGFASQSYAEAVRRRTASDPRPTVLLLCTDFDASGEDIARDWVARTGCWDSIERVLLTHEQVQRYGLPAADGKRDDPRWPTFARRHGLNVDRPVQWEVEALPPAELQRLVRQAVAPFVDTAVLEAVVAEEERQRAALAAFIARWPT
jgi:hypothetical protein